MREISEPGDWDATMDALELNWRLGIADGRFEYRSEYLALYGTGEPLPDEKPESD